MKTVLLRELAREGSNGRAGDRTDLPVYSVTKHAGFVPSLEYFRKQVFSRDLADYKVVHPGDLAYATIHLDEGSVGIAPAPALISPMYTVFTVDDSRVDGEYLVRYLKSPRAMAHYPQLGKGAIHRRKAISLAALGMLPVPLPSLDEQRRIVAILATADAIRVKRRALLSQFEVLIRASFLERFGDPTRPSSRSATARIGSLAKVVTGNSPSRANPENFGDAIEWIKSGDLGGPIATRAEEGLSPRGRQKARVAPVGSVLVTCIAGSPTSIGKCSLVDREVAFNQQINAVLPSEALAPAFLLAQLKVAPQLVRLKSSGGMKGLVSKSAFESIEIIVPPLAAQQEFADQVTAIDRHRAGVERALAADEELFASLQSRAFSGQL